MSSLVESYEKFIAKNIEITQNIDQFGRLILPFFLREESLIESEAGYTVLNVVSWYHNTILSKYQIKNTHLQKDERFRTYFKVGQIIQLIEYVTLMIEMGLVRLKKSRYPIVLVIEIVKSLLKLYAVFKAKTQTPIYINYKNLPTDESIQYEEQPQSITRDPSINALFGEGADATPTKLLLAHPGAKKTNHQLLYAGEILHAVRPVIYVLSLMRFGGATSWRPFIISLCVDVIAQIVTRLALSQPQYADKRGHVLEEEISTRESNFTYYLLKSPAFELTIKPLLEKMSHILSKIPLLGSLLANWLEFVVVCQRYFYYSEF
ncbi:peroxin [Acrasis kona]|uniref:Peroxisomal membrane protein PEX16 n=1 Tax=Acrasis kona TaxID=1008807 RepID=A0AAW2YXM5_9EUKA